MQIRSMPDDIRGCLTIVWPKRVAEDAKSAVPGWMVAVKDTITGKPVNTVTAFDLHLDAEGTIWGEFYMFVADEDQGEPALVFEDIYQGSDGLPVIGLFYFLVNGFELSEGSDEAPDIRPGN